MLAQRAWIGHRRGRALALFVGPDDGNAIAELERLRGRQVEWLVSVDPAALRERLAWSSPDRG